MHIESPLKSDENYNCLIRQLLSYCNDVCECETA